jgi:hypothetical protein
MNTTRHIPRRLGGALAASGVALLLAAGAASADSIAYVKGGDVWLSTPDGARQYQVTTDGGYSTVSQADNGRIAALRGDRIVTLNPDGSPVRADGTTRFEVRTPHSYTMPGTTFRGPFDPAISPDGMKIAYTWYYTQYGETPNCNPSTGCTTVYGRQGTNYIAPDGTSPFDKPGWQEQTGWVGPSWHQDGETLLSDPIQVGNHDVVVHTPGDESAGLPGGLSRWFFDSEAPSGLRDGEMSRDKTKLAFVSGDQGETIRLYRGMGGYPTLPFACYQLNDAVGRVNSPSWSPDGTRLAYADATGVNVLPLPSFANDCGTPTAEHTKRLLIPGATNPDWGPADVPPARPVDGGDGGGNDNGGGGGNDNGGGKDSGGGGKSGGLTPKPDTVKPPKGAAITLRKRVKLGVAIKKGLSVQLSGVRPGTVKIVARLGKRSVGSGRVRVPKSGSARATVKFTAAGRKRLKKLRTARLTLRAGAAQGKVTLKR